MRHRAHNTSLRLINLIYSVAQFVLFSQPLVQLYIFLQAVEGSIEIRVRKT